MEENSADGLVARSMRVSLPRMVVSLPALYRCQKGAGNAAFRRQLKHNSGLSLDDAELVLVGEEGLRQLRDTERGDPSRA